jgi:hypothetical protein
MTTIAYKNGTIAADRQATDGGLRLETDEKLTQRGDMVYAVAGVLATGLMTVSWLLRNNHNPWGEEGECPMKDDDDGTCVVTMDLRTGTVEVWEAPGYPMSVKDKFAAWGSGAPVAIGAMAAGADAVEAVKIASAWDEGTGLGVRAFTAWAE